MLKSDDKYLYVDEELALYVPDVAQLSPLPVQRLEELVLVHRSLLPVSKVKRTVWAGVPSVTLAKYSLS